MPCFANLMYADTGALDTGSIDVFWRETRTLLDDPDDRHARPVAYWLWSGDFESPSAAPDAWRRVTAGEGTGDSGLARVLGASGPVPWAIKEPLLRELARDSRWHGAIFEAIHASRHDIYGSVEPRRALELLKSLRPGGVDRASVADLVTALKGK